MANVSLSGKVTCREGEPAVTTREFGNGGKIAKFSMVDTEYYYAKSDDDRIGQFYSVEVSGKLSEIVEERLKRGDRVAVYGQLVQREYNDKKYIDVKNARVNFLEPRPESGGSSAF